MPGQKSYFSQTQQTVINVTQGLGGNQSFSDFVVIHQQNQLYTYIVQVHLINITDHNDDFTVEKCLLILQIIIS